MIPYNIDTSMTNGKSSCTEEDGKTKELFDIFIVVDSLENTLTTLFPFIAIDKNLRKNIQYH